ncbi:MAG: PLP-dependent cysteine synthase family protein, partial [Faecalibacillus sp.]
MSDIKESVVDLVGNTPLLRVNNLIKKYDLKADVLVKLESFNPAGSAKDRIAREMLFHALEKGTINKETTIIEPTSGNTGIGLASIAASLKMKCVIVMPDSMSKERINMMKAYGAKVILTPGALGMKGSIDKANELSQQIDNSMIAGQFENPDNPLAHYKTTGPEIYNQTDGKVDIFVASIGTGGTISGTGKYLKEKIPNIHIVGVEPARSPLLSQGHAGVHQIQGIGANFIPEALDQDIYDEMITVED